DLRGIDVEPAGDDHVLLAIDNVIIAMFVAAADIAGVVPAMGNGLGRLLRHFEIAATDNAAACDDFADLAGRENIAIIVHQLDADGIAGLSAARETLRVMTARGGSDLMWREPGGDHMAFGL